MVDGARHDAAMVVADLVGADRAAVADLGRALRREGVMTTYDAVVVGARVAGASTAMLLARAGARVLLLERSPYGSDTLSTHGLMRAGVLQLSRWGLLDQVAAAGTPPVTRTLFHYPGTSPVRISIRASHGVPALYAPRRHVLDRILVDAAAAAGVEVRHGVSVTDLLTDPGGRVTGVRGVDAANGTFTAYAKTTIGADGIRSTVAASVGAPVERASAAGGAVLYGYFDGLPTEGLRMGLRLRHRGRADPDERRADLCLRRHHPRAAPAGPAQRRRRRVRRAVRQGCTPR